MGALKLPSIGSLDTLGILFSLLPGLITFILHRSLTARGKKIETVEAILFGLAYTLIIHGMWSVLTSVGSLIPTPDIVGLTTCAVLLGFGLAWLTNSGQLYSWLRKLNLTRETSWSSIWDSAFHEFGQAAGQGKYVVIDFEDDRRLFGAIRGFPDAQENGHLVLQSVKWLHGEDENPPEQPGVFLLKSEDVRMVQFLPDNIGEENEQPARETDTTTPDTDGQS